MSYVVLARKYRPLKFADVVGQPHVVRTIINGIIQKRLAHAYLFSGPRGIGKTTTARLLARAVNCLDPVIGEPCGICRSCIAILENRGLDVLEIDAASNRGIDNIRDLRDNVRYAPIEGKAKVYIIDEVHMLTTESFNALLKTLEEPPEHAYFCLATTSPQKVPSTILSRCQRFDFRRVTSGEIVEHLISILTRENIPFQREALDIIARKADGSIRDSLSILDQVIAFAGGSVMRADVVDVVGDIRLDLYFRALELIQSHSLSEALRIDDELASAGTDPQDYLVGLAEHIVLLMQVKALGVEKADVPMEHREQFAESSQQIGDGDLVRILQLCSAAETDVRRNFNPRTRLQLLLVKFATFERSIVIADLIAQISKGTPTTAPQVSPRQPAPIVQKPQTIVPPAARRTITTPPTEAIPTTTPPVRPPITTDDAELFRKACSIWSEVCDDLAKEHSHRAQMIRHGGMPATLSGGTLRINFQAQSHLDIARALLGPLREAITSRLGGVVIELQIGPISSSLEEPKPEDEATKLLTSRWGARVV